MLLAASVCSSPNAETVARHRSQQEKAGCFTQASSRLGWAPSDPPGPPAPPQKAFHAHLDR